MKSQFTIKAFAENVFDNRKMRKYLPRATYKAIIKAKENGTALSDKHIEIYAKVLKKWAIKKGVTRYTHWFQPLNNLTAEKRDSFNSINKSGDAIVKFRGKELLCGEGDASSLPNGGMRDSYEARGITKWDNTAFPFIKGDCLCIPTTFCGANGETLDKKTPLVKACAALNKQTLRLLYALNIPAKQVKSVVGAEQEYFLINKSLFDKRKDLVYTGRTLFGKVAPKGQEFDDHYFRPPTDEIIKFMQDVDAELWKLGIIVKTEHNEVAPCQYELAPCYSEANCACDQNQLIMETLNNVALKHGFTCLLHEKPFDKINGSGKHNNWSLIADYDCNLLESGDTPQQNARFLLILSAVIKAIDDYNELLISSVTSASNDLRLGGYEAPPKVLTIFLGEPLTNTIIDITKGKFVLGRDLLPSEIYVTDRNRTSSMAFCGNKFEFRMTGSSACIADVNTVLNTIVAESMRIYADELERSSDIWQTAKNIVCETFGKHSRVIYNGNGYSNEWLSEAKERNLLAIDSDKTLTTLTSDKTIELFERHGIFTRRELNARKLINLKAYCDTVHLECIVASEIYERQISPTAEMYELKIAKLAKYKQELSLNSDAENEKIEELTRLQNCCLNTIERLKQLLKTSDSLPLVDKAEQYENLARKLIGQLRNYVNELEQICPKSKWPLPTYGQLLFGEK